MSCTQRTKVINVSHMLTLLLHIYEYVHSVIFFVKWSDTGFLKQVTLRWHLKRVSVMWKILLKTIRWKLNIKIFRDCFGRVNIAVFPCAITHLVSQRNEGNLVVGGSLFICFQICPQTKRAREWITKVCSEHFKSEDFLCGGESPQVARCLLKNTAVPSVVPWPSHSVSKERTTNTSLKSASLVCIGE